MFLIVLLLRFLIHASPFVEEYQENCYSDNPSSMITNRILSGMGCISFGAVFYESTCFEGLGEVYFYTEGRKYLQSSEDLSLNEFMSREPRMFQT